MNFPGWSPLKSILLKTVPLELRNRRHPGGKRKQVAATARPKFDTDHKQVYLPGSWTTAKYSILTAAVLAGSIDMYSEEIPDIQNRLDTLAETIVTRFNETPPAGFWSGR